jgi:hypothetical protein
LFLKNFGLFEGRERGVSSRSVLIIPVYNPAPGFSLKDGDFRGPPDREPPGHEHRNTNFCPEIDQKVGKIAAARFSPLLGGDLNPFSGFYFPLFSMVFSLGISTPPLTRF